MVEYINKHIELYLKPTKYPEATHQSCLYRVLSTDEYLSPTEERVKKYIKDLADQNRIKITTYDLTKSKVSMKAFFKGIRKPTIVICDSNNILKVPIVDDLSEKYLESLIL